MTLFTRAALFCAALSLAGCQSVFAPKKEFKRLPDSNDAWNTNYLIDIDVTETTMEQIKAHAEELEVHYWKYAQVDGILWPPWRSDPSLEQPDRWIDGGDSGIFTGLMLAGWSFKYGTTKAADDLQKVKETLRGIWILTHATGKPGVICRNAAPIANGAKFGYPDEVGHRIERGFVGQGPPLVDPFNVGEDPAPDGGYWYYTRATRDQLTGIIAGLSVAWAMLEPADVPPGLKYRAQDCRWVIKKAADDIYQHLLAYDWRIRDENGKNDTTADGVDGLLKAMVLGLLHAINPTDEEIEDAYLSELLHAMDLRNVLIYADRFSNYDGYFAHNLRTARLLSLYLLETDSLRRELIRNYMEQNVWQFTRGHRNAFFCFARNGMFPESLDLVEDGVRGLQGLVHRPVRMWSSPFAGQKIWPNIAAVAANRTNSWVLDTHLRKPTDYWEWQKAPWDTNEYPYDPPGFDTLGNGDLSGAGYLTTYWMGRYFKLF